MATAWRGQKDAATTSGALLHTGIVLGMSKVSVKEGKIMHIVSSAMMATGALAAALILAAWQPSVAGPVCNELDLRSPCIRSNDVRANIALGGATGDARLRLRNEDGANAVDLQASTGNVTNLFSNEPDQSNGLVKAWARINANGTIAACWRCNKDPSETRRISAGLYEVDFTPLATDITGRPRSAHLRFEFAFGGIATAEDSGDLSSLLVGTRDHAGQSTDATFFLIIF
jgi:hypothetical protein